MTSRDTNLLVMLRKMSSLLAGSDCTQRNQKTSPEVLQNQGYASDRFIRKFERKERGEEGRGREGRKEGRSKGREGKGKEREKKKEKKKRNQNAYN